MPSDQLLVTLANNDSMYNSDIVNYSNSKKYRGYKWNYNGSDLTVLIQIAVPFAGELQISNTVILHSC